MRPIGSRTHLPVPAAFTAVVFGVMAMGIAAERKGHKLTAAAHFLRACCYYQTGERLISPRDKKSNAIFRKSVELNMVAVPRMVAHLVDGMPSVTSSDDWPNQD